MNANVSGVIAAGSADNGQRIDQVLSGSEAGRMQSPTTRNAVESLIPDIMSRHAGERKRPAVIMADVRMHDNHMLSTIAHTLEWNRLTPHNSINATAREGHVTLTGYAYTHQAREEAEMLVRRVPGVCDVDNNIEVLKEDILSNQLKGAIAGVLMRHTQRICDGVSVEIKNGRVVLTGKVGSIAEKRLILDMVGWTHYVSGVEDRLEVAGDRI